LVGCLYNEMKPRGVDYPRDDRVAADDSMHRKFRDYAKASDEIIRRLSLDSNSIVIDLGSGTGAFALHAAKTCRTVYAVDISAAMLEYRRQPGRCVAVLASRILPLMPSRLSKGAFYIRKSAPAILAQFHAFNRLPGKLSLLVGTNDQEKIHRLLPQMGVPRDFVTTIIQRNLWSPIRPGRSPGALAHGSRRKSWKSNNSSIIIEMETRTNDCVYF
jgi:SAM-dependent methyltransferase